MNSLLHGIRVLDLSRLLPGPFCTLYLAQLGAEVIKLEEPGSGDYARSLSPELFELVNRGKRSVLLDLRQPDGVQALHRLVRDADVLLESFRPGVMDRLGCGYATLKDINPRLVYAALTGYGQDGPYRDRAGHDINYCAYAGVLDQQGAAGGPPVLGNTQIADLAGGALTCALGILAAVIGAQRSGQGCFIDASMLDGSFALQAVALSSHRALGHSMPRGSDMLTGGLPNYGLYECADGKWFALGALEQKFWRNFCTAAGRPELAQQRLAAGHAGEPLRAELRALFKTRRRDDWEALLADRDACASGVYSIEEALANPQLRARGRIEVLDGKPAPAMPLGFVDARIAPGRPAPRLGADTDEVLGPPASRAALT